MRFIPNAIARGVARQGLLAQKHSPTILFGVGVVGMVGSTVLACRATLKLHEVVEASKADLKKPEEVHEKHPEKFTENDARAAKAGAYARSVGRVTRLYAPSVILGCASVACLAQSHNILVKRNAAITAAYVAVDEAFKKYRSRVREKYGEQEDLRLMHGSEPVEILSEAGNITHSERVGTDEPSMYARFFDELSTEWNKNPEYNFVFLKSQQAQWNNTLLSRGFVFLNEVYRALGLEETQAGSVVGWILTKDGGGDNHIDFGLYADNPQARDFVNGRERSVLLDFNVDGLIWDKLPSSKRSEKLRWQD